MADEPTYTISVPGLQDVIRVPALESVALKRERIQRMRAARTPLPEGLQWIPQAINWLDDIQDALIVALVAGKFILRRLPAAVIPGVGWALLASDILNVSVSLLGTLAAGRPPKLDAFKSLIAAVGGRAAIVHKGASFLAGRTRWLGFALQAGQVLRSVTGYGLQLGGIMGAATDATWAVVRAAGGADVKVILPPPDDPLAKAWRVLQRVNYLPFILGGLSSDDAQLAVAGVTHAIETMWGGTDTVADDGRLMTLADQEIPLYTPWEPSSREALGLEGIDPDGPSDHALPFFRGNPTMGEAFRVAGGAGGSWDVDNASTLAGGAGPGSAKALADDGSSIVLDVFNGPGSTGPALTP